MWQACSRIFGKMNIESKETLLVKRGHEDAKATDTKSWVPYDSGPWIAGIDFRARHCTVDATASSLVSKGQPRTGQTNQSLRGINSFHGGTFGEADKMEPCAKRHKIVYPSLEADRGQLIQCRPSSEPPVSRRSENPDTLRRELCASLF